MGTDSKKSACEQLTLFDILNASVDALTGMPASDLEAAIEKLRKAKQRGAEKREAERRRREQEEQERREREEREKKEAHIRDVTCMELPLDWNNAYFADPRAQGVHFESSADALVHCLATLGKVDIEYIASVTGDDCKTVICALKGAIYQNPDTWGECFYQGWETSDEYLSGNLMRKWKSAQKANAEYNGYFSDNLRAIERVLPPAVTAKDISITLGSPWIPADIIDVMEHLFGDPLIKERVEAANELSRYRTLQRKLVESRTRMEQELLELPGKKAHQAELIARCRADAAFYAAWKQSHSAAAVPKAKQEEERRRFRQQLHAAVRGNVLQMRESYRMDYRGFRILLPANMTPEKPYIWLERSGRYYVELGDTEVGNLIRVDHFLDELPGHLDGLKRELRKMEEKESDIQAELAKGESYADEIEKYRKRLAKLDKMLGVTGK